MKQNDFVVDTSLVGVVMNGLSHLGGAETKAQFAVKLIRGLGGNLHTSTRVNFAKEVRLPIMFFGGLESLRQSRVNNESPVLGLTFQEKIESLSLTSLEL